MAQPPPPTGLPGPMAFLQPARKRQLREQFKARLARGETAAVAIGALAMQHGLAPSFVSILLHQSPGDAAPSA